MPPDPSGHRSRSARALRWLTGTTAVLGLLAVLAVLAVLAGAAWMLGHQWPAAQQEREAREVAATRERADRAAEGLAVAARAGALDAPDITAALGPFWHLAQSPGAYRITVDYHSHDHDRDFFGCYRFTVPRPLGPETEVTWSEITGSCSALMEDHRPR